MNLKTFTITLILKLHLIRTGLAERAKDQMYEYFDGSTSCFRRLNATHQVGCSSKKGGSTGIIHFVETQENLNFIIKNGVGGNYIPILPMQLLTRKTIDLLIQAKIFSGLVLYKNNETLSRFSHDHTCPNMLSNTPHTCDVNWNEYGTGLLYEDLPFPVYFVKSEEDLEKMKSCFNTFNNYSYETHNMRSLCLVELDAFMFATTDTPTCVRRSISKSNMNPVKFCDPLGGDNVWASLFPLQNKKGEDYVVLAARLDTTSLFHGMFPGATSPVTAIVTLLTVADYLRRMVQEDDKYEKNLLFLLFNGESYNYIGSQRMVYDMEKGEFPVKPETVPFAPSIRVSDISLFIELSHLSNASELFLHSHDKHNAFYDQLLLHNLTKVKEVVGRLPPVSVQSFLRVNPNVSAVVLANYKDKYINKFYNSINDNASNIDYIYYNMTEEDNIELPLDSIQQFTANVSQMLAWSLYKEIMGIKYNGTEKVRVELVDELYNCYLLDADCKVHQAVQRKKLRESPYNSYGFYVGVTVVPNLLTYAIGLTLAWLSGSVTNNPCVTDANVSLYQYFNMSKSLDNLNTTLCYRSMMNFTEAISPAFIIDDYDWTSGQYSSWSESTWKDFNVRMFLRPSPAHERFTLAVGSIVLVMSIIIVYFIKSRSNVLFLTVDTCSPTSC